MSYIEKNYITYKVNEYATHQPFLWHFLKKTDKPILELGSGYGSTPLLHAYSAKHKIPLYTLDHDKEWLSRFSCLESELHTLLSVDVSGDWLPFEEAIPKEIEFGIIFIDHGSWQSRLDCARLLKDRADYILVHDFDNLVMAYNFGRVIRPLEHFSSPGEYDMSSEFPYSISCWPSVKPWPGRSGPPTLIASVKHSDMTLPEEGELEREFIHYMNEFVEPE
jgi:hypothetical protein